MAHIARGTTFVLLDEPALLHTSDAVIVGTVTAIESADANPAGGIHTYVHVQPEQIVKGPLGTEPLVLREPGGTVGDRQEWVYGAPEFWVGERALLFLTRNADGTLQTNNLSMGKFTLGINAAGQTTATRDFGYGAWVFNPSTGDIAEPEPQAEKFEPLLDRLHTLAAAQAPNAASRSLTLTPTELGETRSEFHEAFTFLSSPPVRWFEPDSGQPVSYLVDSVGDRTLGFDASRAAVDAAFGAWTNVSTTNLVLQDGGTSDPGPFGQCDVSRIMFNDPSNEISDPSGCGGTLAIGGICSGAGTTVVNGMTFSRINVGKVTFNNGWGGCWFWDQCGVAEIATHEIGHTIGLGHSSDSTATMAAVAHFDGRCAGLKSDDMNGVTFIYPRSGSPKPTPTRTQTPSRTPTRTWTITPTPTPTLVWTSTRTSTATRTLPPSSTPTRTTTAVPTRTPTITTTATKTPSPTVTQTIGATATPVQVSLPASVTVDAGDQTDITVSVTGGAGLQTFTIGFAYDDTIISPIAANSTLLSANCVLSSDFSTPGLALVAGNCTSPLAGDGALLQLAVVGTGTCGASTSLRIDTCLLNHDAVPCQAGASQVTVDCRVSGHISYYGNGAPVSAATIWLSGQPATQTDALGQFSLGALAANSWQIEPQKMEDAGTAVSALDAVYVLQSTVGLRSLGSEQQRACDITGDGIVTAFDAALILQYAVGLITHFPVAQACGSDWAFQPKPAPSLNQQIVQPEMAGSCQPGSISWTPLVTCADNQDFTAILFGDCTGNWQPNPSRASTAGRQRASAAADAAHIRIGRARRLPHSDAIGIPIYVRSETNFEGLDLQLQYDPARLQLIDVQRLHRARQAILAVNSLTPGQLRVALAGVQPLHNGALLLLKFKAHDGHPHTALSVTQATLARD